MRCPAVPCIIAIALGVVAIAGQARAGLEICNETNLLQSVAIGYKGETDWTSEGWWNVDPGTCAQVVAGDLTKRYYYYYAEADGREFQGQNYNFCVEADIFTITGDTDCENRGYETLGFREIDTGETATEFTLSLIDQSAVPRPAPSPGANAGGSQDGVTSETTQTTTEPPVVASVTVTPSSLTSGLAPGTFGDAFGVDALFQGCELEKGVEYCGFHAAGWKLRAYYDGPTPDDLLFALEEMPINTFVRLRADMGETSGLQAAIVIREVRHNARPDPHARMRAAMQGDWADSGDRRTEFTIRGSELYRRRDGKLVGTSFLQVADACGDGAGPGPVLIETDLATRAPVCTAIATLQNGTMRLRDAAAGRELAFRKLR